MFGGGPLLKPVGDLLVRQTLLCNALGSTEADVMPGMVLAEDDPNDWPYTGLSPALGAEYRHVSGDLYMVTNPAIKIVDLYEGLLMKRKQPQPQPQPETKNTASVSPTLAGLQCIDVSLMQNWLRQWAA